MWYVRVHRYTMWFAIIFTCAMAPTIQRHTGTMDQIIYARFPTIQIKVLLRLTWQNQCWVNCRIFVAGICVSTEDYSSSTVVVLVVVVFYRRLQVQVVVPTCTRYLCVHTRYMNVHTHTMCTCSSSLVVQRTTYNTIFK